MKSSSNLIRATDKTEEIQPWSLNEFEQDTLISSELIRSSAIRLFGLNTPVSQSEKRNLVKADKAANGFSQWQPADMNGTAVVSQKTAPQPWMPFIEKPNPRKIAEKIVEEAQTQSDAIIASAQETIDQIRREAYNQGLENAKADMRETLQAATAVINVAREWRSDMMNQAEPMIMDLVKKIAQKMFGDGIVLDNATLQQHFASVLETARSLDDLRIYMNPQDANALGPDWREYQASLLGHKVEIISNDSIKRGGCYIQGEWGTADALVETQLTTIVNQFSEVEQPEKEDD
jgi:flagellar assembly protein FliH